VVAHFYIVDKYKFSIDKLDELPNWNVATWLAYVIKAGTAGSSSHQGANQPSTE
jgi:hypothetical protein